MHAALASHMQDTHEFQSAESKLQLQLQANSVFTTLCKAMQKKYTSLSTSKHHHQATPHTSACVAYLAIQ